MAKFPASIIDSAFMMITTSAENANIFLWLVHLTLRWAVYCVFQEPGARRMTLAGNRWLFSFLFYSC